VRILVWHLGQRGAGPRFAAELAAGFSRLPGGEGLLALPEAAEIRRLPDPPCCDLPVPTYATAAGFVARLAAAPALLRALDRAIAALRPDLAVCAMPALLDPLMLRALRRRGVPATVIVHDAVAHAGEALPWRLHVQRHALRHAARVLALSPGVAAGLARQTGRDVAVAAHPPFGFGALPRPRAHGGRLRVLSLGRLLPYKGLGLLAAALRLLDPGQVEARIVGQGPESPALAELRAMPIARVENRWVPEAGLAGLLGWADLVLLTHRAASQSGVAAAAVGAGRFVVATDVGGLASQLRGTPGAAVVPVNARCVANAVMELADAIPPVPPDTGAAWAGFAAEVLAASRAQRQPRPMASTSCCWVRSGPIWVPSDPTPPLLPEDAPPRPGPGPPRPAEAPPPREAPPLRP